ncbi:MAG TPA: hypothetical protein VGI21_25475 [Streptosporangiaceae bacterium]
MSPSGGLAGDRSETSVRWISARGPGPRPGPSRSMGRRARRGAELAWLPVDTVLAARDLSNLVVVAATLAVAMLCVRDGGLTAVIVNIPALAVVWGAAYGLIRLGRRWRGVRPPRHEPPDHRR